MTAAQINCLFAWHHVTYHEWCGHNHPTVPTPLYIVAHRQHTAKIDLPTLAKVRRSLSKRQGTQEARPRRKMRSRGSPTREQRAALRAKYGTPE